MSDPVNRLFHSRRPGELEDAARQSGLPSKEEIRQEHRWESSVGKGVPCADLTQPSAWPLLVGFEALTQRRDEILGALIPLHERTALASFVGMGITDMTRYEDAVVAFNELRRMAPAEHSALIHVFSQRHREESKGADFLYLHFAGDRLAFGFLICALISGGFMAGWQLN